MTKIGRNTIPDDMKFTGEVTIRMTKMEKDLLKSMAAQSGMTQCDVVRMLIRIGLPQKRGAWA